jgi:hypothetical protein
MGGSLKEMRGEGKGPGRKNGLAGPVKAGGTNYGDRGPKADDSNRKAHVGLRGSLPASSSGVGDTLGETRGKGSFGAGLRGMAPFPGHQTSGPNAVKHRIMYKLFGRF